MFTIFSPRGELHLTSDIATSADDLQLLLVVLPLHIREELEAQDNYTSLVEIVLDLGRYPQARFKTAMVDLSQKQVSHDDIGFVVSRIG